MCLVTLVTFLRNLEWRRLLRNKYRHLLLFRFLVLWGTLLESSIILTMCGFVQRVFRLSEVSYNSNAIKIFISTFFKYSKPPAIPFQFLKNKHTLQIHKNA